MNNILLVYSTNSGSTAEVARAIAEELARDGARVDVRATRDAVNLDEYQAVVVGAPMILGWQREAVSFVRRHRAQLAGKRVAYFATAMSLTQPAADETLPAPAQCDPYLVSDPRDPGRLSLKEQYARVSNYLKPMLSAAPEARPLRVGFFGGKLELFRLPWWQAAFVMLVIHAQPGDRRNWDFIREWAAGLRAELSA